MARKNSYRSTERTRKGAVTKFGSRTDIGCVREQNEDSLIVKPPLFVVADGMGGHAAGEVASEICVKTIEREAPAYADAEKLGAAVEQANRDIITAAVVGEGHEGMGTTCTAAVLDNDRLVIAQVGDSRAYLLHAGKLSQLTRDHSLMANMIESGQITPEEARYHPNRSVITRALGNDPETVADLYEINVEADDRLLLCSDGLTAMVEDSRIEAIMNKTADPQRCAAALVNEAISSGGQDNVTVIVADATGPSEISRQRIARRTKLTVAIVLVLLFAILAGAIFGGYSYLHHTAFLANQGGKVAIYRGVPGDVLGLSYSELVELTDIEVDDLPPSASERIDSGMRVNSVEEAQSLVATYKVNIEADKKAKADMEASKEGSSDSSASAEESASSDESADKSPDSELSPDEAADEPAEDEVPAE